MDQPQTPPAIVAPRPAGSDALARPAGTALSPVATPPTEFWPRLALGIQAFDAALRGWRETWPPADGRPAWQPASLRPASVRPPRPGSMRAVQAGIVQGASYWKHALMPTMALDQEVVGYVSLMVKKPNADGDIPIDVVPLPAYAPVLMYEGRYRPRIPYQGALTGSLYTEESLAMGLRCGAIHCEIKANAVRGMEPFLLDVRRLLQEGRTPVVAMRGRWTFDPFHAGWVEIHPVREARIVSPDGSGYPPPLPLPAALPGNDDEP